MTILYSIVYHILRKQTIVLINFISSGVTSAEEIVRYPAISGDIPRAVTISSYFVNRILLLFDIDITIIMTKVKDSQSQN